MISLKKVFSVILIIVTCASLSSCIGVDRFIKINSDGSGEETMKITLMKEFYGLMSSMATMMDSARQVSFLDSLYNDDIFMDKTKTGYDSIEGIEIIDISSVRNYDSSSTFIVKYKFDNLDVIGKSLQKTLEDEGDNNGAETEVRMIPDGDNVLFSYKYDKPEEETMDDSTSMQMKNSLVRMFENGFINFEIEFPYEVVSSNATTTNGNTLKWNFPMSEIFMESKLDLEVIMKK